MVRYLPEVKPKIPLMGVSHTDIPPHRDSTSSKPAAGEGQGHSVPQTGGPRLAKKASSGCARRKIKKERVTAREAETGGFQQPGNASAPKQGENSTKASKRPRSEGSTPTEMIREPKRPRDLNGPGIYKEALTNINIAIFKESYPEDELNEDDQKYIMEELGKVLRRTPLEELPHLKSYRLKGQWLIKAVDNHRLVTRDRLKVTEASNLPKPVKLALRTKDNVAQTQDELLTWVKNLNPGLNTEHWKVLNRTSEPTSQRLIVHIDRDSLVAISIGYKIFTGRSQGTVMVLKDPEAQRRFGLAFSKSVSEHNGEDIHTPPDDQPGAVKSSSADQRTPLMETQSDERETAKEERMEIDSPPKDNKE
jgi:hypothetical protein